MRKNNGHLKTRDYHKTMRLYMRLMTSKDMVPLTDPARQYSEESSGYVIQSWMRSRISLESLRQWENDMKEKTYAILPCLILFCFQYSKMRSTPFGVGRIKTVQSNYNLTVRL